MTSFPKAFWGGGFWLALYYSWFMLYCMDESLVAEPVLDLSFTFLMSLVLTTLASS